MIVTDLDRVEGYDCKMDSNFLKLSRDADRAFQIVGQSGCFSKSNNVGQCMFMNRNEHSVDEEESGIIACSRGVRALKDEG